MKKTSMTITGSPIVNVQFGTGRVLVANTLSPKTNNPVITLSPIVKSEIGSDKVGEELNGPRVAMEFSSVKSCEVLMKAVAAARAKLIEDFIKSQVSEFETELENFLNS